MFGFFETMFIGLLSFSKTSATKYTSLNNEQCKTRLFLISLNPVELKYNAFYVLRLP